MRDPSPPNYSPRDDTPDLRQRLRIALTDSAQSQYIVLSAVALITGVISGYAAIGFYLLIDRLIEVLYGESEALMATGARALEWYTIILIPTLAGLVVGQLGRFLPRRSLHGVPDVIESAALAAGRIPLRTGLISAGATIIALGAGSSTGREGPVAHLGAALASAIVRLLRLNARFGRTILGCGVAAAVAASFNAPIAGALFALEVVIGHYAVHTLAPIILAAIAGTLVSHIHLGDFPAFVVAERSVASLWEFPAFGLLGIVAAIAAAIFMTSTLGLSRRISDFRWLSASLAPACGGCLMGIIALWHPEVLGIGYEATTRAIGGEYGLILLVSILMAKLVATVLSIGFRFGGGVFSPSLVLGAMLGGAFGNLAALAFPDLASDPGVYVIVGMGSLAAAVLGAPLSTILMVFEITRDYSLTAAVMIGVALSTSVVTFFQPRSYFHQLLANRNVHLEGGRATYLLKSECVGDHMSRDFFTVRDTEPLTKARDMLILQGGGLLVVTAEAGGLVGTLTLDDLSGRETSDQHAGDLACTSKISVDSNAPLQEALRLLELSKEEALPVVSAEDRTLVVGTIRHRDVMKAYNAALLDAQGREVDT